MLLRDNYNWAEGTIVYYLCRSQGPPTPRLILYNWETLIKLTKQHQNKGVSVVGRNQSKAWKPLDVPPMRVQICFISVIEIQGEKGDKAFQLD